LKLEVLVKPSKCAKVIFLVEVISLVKVYKKKKYYRKEEDKKSSTKTKVEKKQRQMEAPRN